MPDNNGKLKLGKGVYFVKNQLRRLRQENETWEVDFRALPKPMMQPETHYLGMVLTQPCGYLLAEVEIEYRPTVNDLAMLLANAMRRPFDLGSHRPRRIHVRGHRQWQELFPHLTELGVEVSVQKTLPKINEAYGEYLQQIKKSRSAKKITTTAKQSSVETLFPAIAQWVQDGHIEIGDQQESGFVVRALDCGGLVFEDDKPRTLAEALASLEKGLRKWFKAEGIELKK